MNAAPARSSVFITVFLLLCGLTAASFAIANSALMDRPVIGWCAMLSVSVAKALLVLLFFMHLWWEESWKYIFTVPVTILAVILVLLLIPDIGWRTDNYSNDRKSHSPIPLTLDAEQSSRIQNP